MSQSLPTAILSADITADGTASTQTTTLEVSTKLQTELLKKLSKMSTITGLLEDVVRKAHEELCANACSIFIVDPGKKRATQRAGTGYQAQFVDRAHCRIAPLEVAEQRPGQLDKLGITGWSLSTGKSFLARTPKELEDHPHRSGEHDLQQLAGEQLILQTFLCIPLYGLYDKVIGVIKAERRALPELPPKPFSIHDQIVLETLGHVASKCHEYLHMVQQGREDAAITAWARSIIAEAEATAGELDSFLQIVASVTAAAMQADSCGIYLTDREKKTLTQRAGTGSQTPQKVIRSYKLPDEISEACDEIAEEHKIGVTAWIALKKERFHARNYAELHQHPHHKHKYDHWNFPEKEQIECGAFLGIPLKVGDEITGVLKVENKARKGEPDTRDFPESAQHRFDILGQNIALAVERLREQIDSRYKVINDASPQIFDILRGRHDLQDLAFRVVTATQKIFNARACALFLKEGNQLIQPEWAAVGWAKKGTSLRTYRIVPPETIKEQPLTKDQKIGLTAWIATKKEYFFARSNEELKAHPHHLGYYDPDNFEQDERCESFMGAPLLVRDETVGVLKVETKMDGPGPNAGYTYFTEQDELVFKLIANSVAIAIENARLWEVEHFVKQLRDDPARRANLLVELHNFARNPWNAADTLKQAANRIQSEYPQLAKIIQSYAALLPPEFIRGQVDGIQRHVDDFERHVAQIGEFLIESRAVRDLYQIFCDALGAISYPNIVNCCNNHIPFGSQLHDQQFFLHDAADILSRLFHQIARSSALGQTLEYIEEAQRAAENLPQPERQIISAITKQWKGKVQEERVNFVHVQPPYQRVGNPYQTGLPIQPQADMTFFGRQDGLQWISEELRDTRQPPILVLYGERRIGKTSLLLQIERGRFGELLRQGGDRLLYPVWVNLQSLTDPGMSGFLYGLARIIARCPSLTQRVPMPEPEGFRDQPGAAFDEFLDQVSAAINPGLLVLMLDEFETLEARVARKTIGPEIFEYLRHQMQSQANVTFILSGVHRLDDMSSAYRSIVDTLALHHEIGFMDQSDTERLVREPVAPVVTYENLAVERIWRLTHGHPYFIQLLCHIMISDMNRRADSNFIRNSHLTEAVEQVLNENYAQLSDIWKSVCPEDQLALAAVADMTANEDNSVRCGTITAMLTPDYLTEDQLRAALKRLVTHSLLAPVDLGKPVGPETDYRFAFDLLRLWVMRQHPLPSAMREWQSCQRDISYSATEPYRDRYEELSDAT